MDIELAEERLPRLDEVSRIELGFPHDFVGRVFAHGDTFELVEDHRGRVYTEIESRP